MIFTRIYKSGNTHRITITTALMQMLEARNGDVLGWEARSLDGLFVQNMSRKEREWKRIRERK